MTPRTRPAQAKRAAAASRIHFGTDGWRAIIAEDFTFANVARVAQATAASWNDFPASPARPRTVVIGFDRRFLSDQFARTAAEVFLGNGYSVVLANAPLPTPAVSFAVKKRRAAGGVMITASHNPPTFNGFKLKGSYGGPALSGDAARIEQLIDRHPIQRLPLPAALSRNDGHNCTVRDLTTSYLNAVRSQVDFSLIARSKLRLAHDAMFGVGAGTFATLLARSTCRVTTLNARHDPYFGGINPEPIPRNYQLTAAYLRTHPHDLCLVTDGDADRIGGLDGRGHALSTHQIICLLILHLIASRQARGRIVKALTTSSMVDAICAEHGLPLVETGVGFKNITAEILRGGVMLGAEESGSIGFPDHLPERDGILAGMFLLELLAQRRRPIHDLLAELEKRYGPHRYVRQDLTLPPGKGAALMEYCRRFPPSHLARSPIVKVNTSDGVKYSASNGSWLMLRSSGTEPLVRVYAEARSDAQAHQLIKTGVAMIRQAG
jgi:phosphomannomutase